MNVKLPASANKGSLKNDLQDTVYEKRQIIKAFLSRAISKQAWKVLIPAALYVVQNNLYLYASSRLEPSVFQALWQLRLIPTAYLSQVLLRKHLGLRRWVALYIVLIGVIAIQQAGQTSPASLSDTTTARQAKVAAIAVLMLAAITASLAGVLLEKVFQEKETSLWIANFQLSTFSIAPAAFVLFVECGQSENVLDPFRTFGTSWWPWITAFIQGFAGILVALTTKYAGCIAGSISGIASIAVSHLIEVVRREDANLSAEAGFIIGFVLVAGGAYGYTFAPAQSVAMIEAMIEETNEESTTLLEMIDGAHLETEILLEKSISPYKDALILPELIRQQTSDNPYQPIHTYDTSDSLPFST